MTPVRFSVTRASAVLALVAACAACASPYQEAFDAGVADVPVVWTREGHLAVYRTADPATRIPDHHLQSGPQGYSSGPFFEPWWMLIRTSWTFGTAEVPDDFVIVGVSYEPAPGRVDECPPGWTRWERE